MNKPNGWENLDRDGVIGKALTKLYLTDDENSLGNSKPVWDCYSIVMEKLSQAILSAEEKAKEVAYHNDLLREIMEEMPKKQDQEWIDFGENKLMRKQHAIGFNKCHDQVNTLLESKLSTVKGK